MYRFRNNSLAIHLFNSPCKYLLADNHVSYPLDTEDEICMRHSHCLLNYTLFWIMSYLSSVINIYLLIYLFNLYLLVYLCLHAYKYISTYTKSYDSKPFYLLQKIAIKDCKLPEKNIFTKLHTTVDLLFRRPRYL